MVSLNTRNRICNALPDPFGRTCLLNAYTCNVFKIITRISKSKSLKFLCDYKCKYVNVIQIRSEITINVHVSVHIQKKIVYAEHILIGILTSAFGFNSTYTKKLINDSIVTCDEIVEAVANSYVDLSRNCDK